MKQSRIEISILIVFFLALGVRLVLVFSSPPTPEAVFTRLNDSTDYDQLARGLFEGKYRTPSGGPTAFRPPVYPAFLSLVYLLFGKGNLTAVALIQALLGSLNAILAFRLAGALFRKNGGKAASLLAGLGMALYPAFIFQTCQILTEVLGRTLFLGSLYLLAVGMEKRPGKRLVFAGVLLGLGILTKSVLAAAAPFVIVWAILRYPENRWKRGFYFALPAVFLVGMWTVRNAAVSGRFIPVSTNFPITFAHGATRFCYYSNLWYGPDPLMPVPDDFQELTQMRFYSGVKEELELGGRYGRMALEYMGDHPGFMIRMTLRKVLHFWSPVIRNTPAKKIVAFVSMAPVLFLGWLGIILGLKRGGEGRWNALLALAVALPVSVPYILSQPDIRYRVSLIDPLWIVIGSWVLVSLFRRVRNRPLSGSSDPAPCEARDG